MGLLTIGEFARRARLTPKALRLYDRLGLLPPAAVDPDSGYRLYDPRQLRQARLVARLRQIDMPLAEIREVCAALQSALAAGRDPAETVQSLIELVTAAGAPDNVACVVADVV